MPRKALAAWTMLQDDNDAFQEPAAEARKRFLVVAQSHGTAKLARRNDDDLMEPAGGKAGLG